MILLILAYINAIILLLLAFLHFNWALGGKWGFENSLPSKESGEKLFVPGKSASAIVGLGILVFACIMLTQTPIVTFQKLPWIERFGIWVVAAIFFIRSIGDFKYVGFFKSIKNTDFGKMDSKFYSPLCLFISLIAVLLGIF